MYFIFKSKKKKKSFSCHLAAVGNNMAPSGNCFKRRLEMLLKAGEGKSS